MGLYSFVSIFDWLIWHVGEGGGRGYTGGYIRTTFDVSNNQLFYLCMKNILNEKKHKHTVYYEAYILKLEIHAFNNPSPIGFSRLC